MSTREAFIDFSPRFRLSYQSTRSREASPIPVKENLNVFMNNYGGLNHTHKQFSFQSPLERRQKVFQAKVILPSHDDVSESLLPAAAFR